MYSVTNVTTPLNNGGYEGKRIKFYKIKPAEASKAPSHPRFRRPSSHNLILTNLARASMPNSIILNPLRREDSMSEGH
jgi:hypothetical protein